MKARVGSLEATVAVLEAAGRLRLMLGDVNADLAESVLRGEGLSQVRRDPASALLTELGRHRGSGRRVEPDRRGGVLGVPVPPLRQPGRDARAGARADPAVRALLPSARPARPTAAWRASLVDPLHLPLPALLGADPRDLVARGRRGRLDPGPSKAAALRGVFQGARAATPARARRAAAEAGCAAARASQGTISAGRRPSLPPRHPRSALRLLQPRPLSLPPLAEKLALIRGGERVAERPSSYLEAAVAVLEAVGRSASGGRARSWVRRCAAAC